ncbi:MAG: hypothetical protein ACK55Z_14670, partial [bacterium]
MTQATQETYKGGHPTPTRPGGRGGGLRPTTTMKREVFIWKPFRPSYIRVKCCRNPKNVHIYEFEGHIWQHKATSAKPCQKE